MTKKEILEEAKLSMPEGWFLNFGERMVDELCEILGDDIEKYEIVQIKEKLGELRWYSDFDDFEPFPPEYYDWLNYWEEYSAHCCWQCGAPAEIRYEDSWYLPWCDACYAEHKEAMEESKFSPS